MSDEGFAVVMVAVWVMATPLCILLPLRVALIVTLWVTGLMVVSLSRWLNERIKRLENKQ